MMTCNSTDALLRVEYNITRDAWDSSRSFLSKNSYGFTPFLSLDRQGDFYLDTDHVWYESFADLRDYEACVPRDECSNIVVGGLPTDGYKLSFDGEALDIGYEFFFDGVNPATYTDVGICPVPPVCDDGEALLEIQYWEGSDSQLESFRVEDKDSNIVLDEDDLYYTMSRMTKYYSCLPRDDACYTFLIGGTSQGNTDEPAASYSVIYDGKLVRSSDSWLFDSVQFGDSCELLCNPEDESQVEFFMYDYVGSLLESNFIKYEWSLSSPSETLDSGVVPMGPGISPLVYMSKCIPKDSCASFNIVAPANVDPAHDVTYTLTMDNVIYRKTSWYIFDQTSWPIIDTKDQTTNMGSCTVTGLCDEDTQDLFHLELRTQATNEKTKAPFPKVSLPMIGYDSIAWHFGGNQYREGQLFYSGDYNDRAYDLDTKYGVIECVPKDDCDLNFFMKESSPVESYTVKKNGIQLNETQQDGAFLKTPFFDQNKCFPPTPQPSSSVPGIGIDAIVIACVVAVGAVVAA